ncbi:hypothetical protein VTK26DRAFT_7879 [Humicola hyalothermophila]
MQPSNMSDTDHLDDSAFEIISYGTETESQDGHLSESTSSLSISRPDDVQSLDESDNPYDNESDNESDDASRASSIRYADQALQNPSTQPPTSSLHSAYGPTTEGSGVVVGSIDFHEGDNSHSHSVLEEEISVTHAIREFSEEESSAMAEDLDLENAPRRLVATVRQTVSQARLSTREPLRVLYVGPPEAERGIVLKICSAICAPSKIGADNQDCFNRHREGVYNIVPVSSFGSAPELELMEASRYQIKVEHCFSAWDGFSQEATLTQYPEYTLMLDQGKICKSIQSDVACAVTPRWDLPHIAVFYTSELHSSDYNKAFAATRTLYTAQAFMERHGVPCIFISKEQDFSDDADDPWDSWINEHTVHLCLESRDPERPMAPKRFPIDYASFVDIDSRQLNRHLAYLTGLCEYDQTPINSDDEMVEGLSEVQFEVLESFSSTKSAWNGFINNRAVRGWILVLVVPVLLSAIAPYIFQVLTLWPQPGDITAAQPPLSTGTCDSPRNYGLTTRKSSSVAASTTTVVINVTSTKTVQVSQAKPSSSALASALSFAGLLSDKPSPVPDDLEVKKPTSSSSKKTACSVHVHSPTELLVAIPSRNKAVWLVQGAIDIGVSRGEDALKTKISAVDEGVLVELPYKEAYGVLNVSVVTTRRPKINETFQVDFGKTAVAEAIETGLQLLQGGLKKMSSSVGEASHAIEGMLTLPEEVASYWEHASESVRTAQHRAAGTVNRAANNARERFARQLESVETLRKEADLSLLQAQIRSRLWWLKVQGKTDEYAEYKRNASRFLKAKHEELVKGKKKRAGEKDGAPSSKKVRAFWGMAPRGGSLWSCKGGCGKDGPRKQMKDEGRDSKWRKMLLGGGE